MQMQKKGVIKKLFSQEARFKQSNNANFSDWKKIKLSDVLEEYKEYCFNDGTYEHVSLTKEGVVPKTERYNRDALVTHEDKRYRVTHVNDIYYNPANLKFGVICRNKYKDAIFSPIYITFNVKEGFMPEFVEALVTRQDFINSALKYQEGTVYERMAVSVEDLLRIKVLVPSIEERQRIVNCLSAFDDVINDLKKTVNHWKTIKKGLLQQLFV